MKKPKKNPITVTEEHKRIAIHMRSLARVRNRYKQGLMPKHIFDMYKDYYLKRIIS